LIRGSIRTIRSAKLFLRILTVIAGIFLVCIPPLFSQTSPNRNNPFLLGNRAAGNGLRTNRTPRTTALGAGQNNPAYAVLRRAAQADKTIPVIGEQYTTLFGNRSITSTQTIYRDGSGDYRCEYHSPQSLDGEIIVSRPDISWHYLPRSHELKVGKGRPHAGQLAVGGMVAAFKSGRAIASLAGQDAVAGRVTDVVMITSSGSGPGGSAKLWIDQQTGILLRTDVSGADNQPISSTYFSSITPNAQFPVGTFDQPQVPANTASTATNQQPILNHIPTDAEAGFHVLTPTYIPAGYSLVFGRVFQVMGRSAISIRYRGNLSTLSVFEAPMPNPRGGNGVPKSTRAGTVLLNQNGMRTMAIGQLSQEDLTQVLRSLR
jgi:outer membrane lipoprotein-sorting protein